MNRNHARTWSAVVFLVNAWLIVPAFAGDLACVKPHVSLTSLLMPPPKAESPETAAELRELQQLESTRTKEQEQHARDDHDRSVERFLGGMGVNVADLPQSATDFFHCIHKATKKEVEAAKETFNRTRPYKLPNNNLRVLKDVGDEDMPSYPSGHATYGMAIGLILAEMLPEKRDDIFRRFAGVHFRSDVYAGEVAGGAIAASLFDNGEFRSQFDKAKVELRKSVGY